MRSTAADMSSRVTGPQATRASQLLRVYPRPLWVSRVVCAVTLSRAEGHCSLSPRRDGLTAPPPKETAPSAPRRHTPPAPQGQCSFHRPPACARFGSFEHTCSNQRTARCTDQNKNADNTLLIHLNIMSVGQTNVLAILVPPNINE